MTEPRYPYVHLTVPTEVAESASDLLWELGASGVEERDATTLSKSSVDTTLLVASFETEVEANEALTAIGEVDEEWKASLEFVVGDAWRDSWKAYFKPTRIGSRLVIRPSWEPFELSANDVEVVLEPGRAFGTGTHESTRLVLGQLESTVKAGDRVLDVGCGSGILAIAAIKLGASHAVCIDVDPDAAEVTRENAEFNRVVSQLEASTTAVQDVAEQFPLVLANIEARVLIPLANAIAARVAPGGSLIMAGILVGQEDDVRRAYLGASAGFGFVETGAPIDGEWISLRMKKA